MQKSDEINNYNEAGNSNCVIFTENQNSSTSSSISVANGGSQVKSVKKVSDSKNRVKFLVDQDKPVLEFDEKIQKESSEMNHNLTSSQPLVLNGHVGNVAVTDLVENQKLANSHPHVTISSNQEHPRGEDRTFGTKIDK